MLLRVGSMVPEEIGEEGEGQVVVAAIWAIEKCEESNSEEIVAEYLPLLHESTLSPLLL